MIRKLIFTFITTLIIPFLYGQDLTVEIDVDNLEIIQTENIPTKEICFGIPNGKVFISKASLIQYWENELAIWEDGVNLRIIQVLLRHESSKTTEVYTHVAGLNNEKTENPLDNLMDAINFSPQRYKHSGMASTSPTK